MIILGIDPGSIRTGFAVVDASSSKPRLITSGVILLDDQKAIAGRLADLAADLDQIISKYAIQSLAIETLFFAKNAMSALKLGHARGVILMKAAAAGMEIFEYSPTQVKASVTGTGRASKEQIAAMCRLLLKLPKTFEFSAADESDALAIALAHLQLARWGKHSPIKSPGKAPKSGGGFWQKRPQNPS